MDKIVDERTLRRYYMHAFGTEAGQMVLKDLANRCFKHSTTSPSAFTGRTEDTLVNEGKRQVLLHIESMMSPEGIAKLAEPEKESE